MNSITVSPEYGLSNRVVGQLLGLSSKAKLRIIKLLADSLSKDDVAVSEVRGRTENMLDAFAGKWKGDESAQEIMTSIRENSTSRPPIQL